MDQASLVVDEIEAGLAFIQEMNRHHGVYGAFWLRPAEDGVRYLYVILNDLTTDNTRETYREVLRIANLLQDRHYIDPFRVRLVGPTDPIAKAMAEMYRRYPGRAPSRYDGSAFVSESDSDAYVYPRLKAVT